MQAYLIIVAIAFTCISNTVADVRPASDAKKGFQVKKNEMGKNYAGSPTFEWDVASTFCYKDLENQKKNNFDQFVRSNIDNEANQRDEQREAAQDMLPCREPVSQMESKLFTRGQTFDLPTRWNNPHDSDCEFNLWYGDMNKICTVQKPFRCGGGYQNQNFQVTVPRDVQGCNTAADGCFFQFYGHSVEPRTYAYCVRFHLAADPAPAAPAVGESSCAATLRDPIHYWDSYDTSHKDQDYSVYRGQNQAEIRDEVQAACDLAAHVGDGGLVRLEKDEPLKNKRKNMKNKIKNLVKKMEDEAKKANKAAQKQLDDAAGNGPKQCYQGAEYGVINNNNCKRQYQNTYITMDLVAGRRAIYNDLKAELAELPPYTATLKEMPVGTPNDPEGQYKKNGKPSLEPQNDSQAKCDIPAMPAYGPVVGGVAAAAYGAVAPAAPVAPVAPLTPEAPAAPADKVEAAPVLQVVTNGYPVPVAEKAAAAAAAKPTGSLRCNRA